MSQRSPQKHYLEQDYFNDPYAVLQKQLGPRELEALRSTSSTLGRTTAEDYQIGLSAESYSQYSGEQKRTGWGMKFFKNPRTGEIWGENKNSSDDHTDLIKRYEGSLKTVKGVNTLVVNVYYDDIGQVNHYEGTIKNKNGDMWFEGTSTVIEPAKGSKRGAGDKAIIVGRVKKFH